MCQEAVSVSQRNEFPRFIAGRMQPAITLGTMHTMDTTISVNQIRNPESSDTKSGLWIQEAFGERRMAAEFRRSGVTVPLRV
jgi:hypothetical protein